MVDVYLYFCKHLGHLLVNVKIVINYCHERDAVSFGYFKKLILF